MLDESAIPENEDTYENAENEIEADQEDEIKEDSTNDEQNKKEFTENETNTLDEEHTESDGKHFYFLDCFLYNYK